MLDVGIAQTAVLALCVLLVVWSVVGVACRAGVDRVGRFGLSAVGRGRRGCGGWRARWAVVCCAAIGVAVGAVVLTGCSDAATDRVHDDLTGPAATSMPSAVVATTATSPPVPGSEQEVRELTRSGFARVSPGDPGCSIAVSRDGEVVFAEAYGAALVETGEPMTTETPVDVGSVSKQFTATAIALLAERGQVDLDASVSRYVAGLPPWAAQVTIRQLVHHTSGVPDFIDLLIGSGTALTEPATNTDVLEVLAVELQFPPGSEHRYSNSGYVLLAEVVRQVSGTDLASFLRSEVFEPAGMIAVADSSGAVPGRASSYTQSGYEGGVATWAIEDSAWTIDGPGGVQTTPTELVRWASQYWNPTVGSSAINTIRLDDTFEVPSGARYGYGIGQWVVDVPDWHKDAPWNGTRLLGHDGAWEGFITSFLVAPEHRVAVAATCTTSRIVSHTDLDAIAERVLFAWVGDTP